MNSKYYHKGKYRTLKLLQVKLGGDLAWCPPPPKFDPAYIIVHYRKPCFVFYISFCICIICNRPYFNICKWCNYSRTTLYRTCIKTSNNVKIAIDLNRKLQKHFVSNCLGTKLLSTKSAWVLGTYWPLTCRLPMLYQSVYWFQIVLCTSNEYLIDTKLYM